MSDRSTDALRVLEAVQRARELGWRTIYGLPSHPSRQWRRESHAAGPGHRAEVRIQHLPAACHEGELTLLPTLTGVGRLTADPELRFTQAGKAVASIPLAFNSRRLNQQTQQWEDGDTFFIRGTVWERLAENATETLSKGMEVIVTGELRTESWEKDGQKHERPALLIRSIAPNLAFAIAKVAKDAASQQNGGGQQRPPQNQQRPQGQQQYSQGPPQDDPWATGATEPPF